MKKKYFILLFSIVILLNSCSIEKRHYRPGFNFTSSKSKPTAEKSANAENNITADENVVVLNSNEPSIENNINSNTSEVKNPITINSKQSNTSDNPTIKSQPHAVKKEDSINSAKQVATKVLNKKTLKGKKPSGVMMSRGLAVILTLMFGWLGLHRFLLGFPFSGTIMLLMGIVGLVTLPLAEPGVIILGLLYIWIISDVIVMLVNGPVFFPR
jgi:TM2 domain-containing membrane protein YozV